MGKKKAPPGALVLDNRSTRDQYRLDNTEGCVE